MKIGIDVQSTVGKMTGLGHYVTDLMSEFKKYSDIEFEHYKYPEGIDLNVPQRMFWENILLPKQINKSTPDLLHVPGFAGPMFKGTTKTVTTVHDLIGKIYPQNLNFASRFYWQKWLPMCVKNSDMIIVISENTKKDVMRFLGVPEEKIKVTLLATSKHFIKIKDEKQFSEVRNKYNLPKQFMLNVGTIEPRKNICGLLRAFAMYLQKDNVDLSLVLVGKKDWGYKQVKDEIEKLGISSKVHFCDYVEDKDLPYIYNLSKFFVFPSFYEGFGLPVLEALSCGCPVISSNVSSLPEITSDAAVLINPNNVEELYKAIEEVDKNDSLREELASKALMQAKNFSWKKTAAKTLEVYKEVISSK